MLVADASSSQELCREWGCQSSFAGGRGCAAASPIGKPSASSCSIGTLYTSVWFFAASDQ
jgi:hypothetical protein